MFTRYRWVRLLAAGFLPVLVCACEGGLPFNPALPRAHVMAPTIEEADESVPVVEATDSRRTDGTDSSLCYEHVCDDASTGKKCFDDRAAYCSSLCAEANCSAKLACEGDCS